jgi:hypothetical protein
VQGVGHQFLAGAGLAGDEHRGLALAQAADGAEHVLHGRRLAQHGLARQAGIQPGHFLDAAAFLQGPVDEFQGVVHVEGLGQVFEGAALEGGDRRIQVGIGGHDDDGQAGLLGLDLLHELQAAHARHADVRHHRAGGFPVQGAQGRLGGVEDAVGQVFPRQGLLEHPSDGAVVVDDPDGFHDG